MPTVLYSLTTQTALTYLSLVLKYKFDSLKKNSGYILRRASTLKQTTVLPCFFRPPHPLLLVPARAKSGFVAEDDCSPIVWGPVFHHRREFQARVPIRLSQLCFLRSYSTFHTCCMKPAPDCLSGCVQSEHVTKLPGAEERIICCSCDNKPVFFFRRRSWWPAARSILKSAFFVECLQYSVDCG